MRLLLVEDDTLLGDGIRNGLKQAGFQVDWVFDVDSANLALSASSYDALLLDLGLPKVEGLTLLKYIRQKKQQIPVIIITARDTVSDRVKGLDLGADDYLVKPFDLNELAARVRAVARRAAGRASPVIEHAGLVVDPASHRVTFRCKDVDVSPKEFTLLEYLLERRGRVLTRAQLEEALYGWNEELESNAVEVHVHHLRKKISPEVIKTIRGVGYTIPLPPASID